MLKIVKWLKKHPELDNFVYRRKQTLAEYFRVRRFLGAEREKIRKDLHLSIAASKINGVYIIHARKKQPAENKIYEPEVKDALIALIGLEKLRYPCENITFVDIGANIGLHTFGIKKKFGDIKIIAFEPSPIPYRFLQLTIALNSFSGIRVENTALFDTEGNLDFLTWGEDTSGDSLRDTKRVKGGKAKLLKVLTKRLDDISDLPSINVIKIDCEGAELPILLGARKVIERDRPAVVLEIHPVNRLAFDVTPEKIFQFLKQVHYALFTTEFTRLDFDRFLALQDLKNENYVILPEELVGKLSETGSATKKARFG